MPAWSLKNGATLGDLDWFLQRLSRARALMRTANFDTVIGEDFQNAITSQLVAVSGSADASASDSYNAGVVTVAAGDSVIASSSGRLQPTGVAGVPPSHVGDLTTKSWYAASLVRIIRPPDAQIGATWCDAVGLYADTDNRVALGILGDVSGGSTTNWVGQADVAAGITTVLGPALDSEEAPVWHLFEQWFDVLTGKLNFAIDGTTFADTIDVANIPGVPAWWAMTSQRDATGNQVLANYDKVAVVVASPRVGGID